jgi:hypothetical protein
MLYWNSLRTIGYAVIKEPNSLSATFKGPHLYRLKKDPAQKYKERNIYEMVLC